MGRQYKRKLIKYVVSSYVGSEVKMKCNGGEIYVFTEVGITGFVARKFQLNDFWCYNRR